MDNLENKHEQQAQASAVILDIAKAVVHAAETFDDDRLRRIEQAVLKEIDDTKSLIKMLTIQQATAVTPQEKLQQEQAKMWDETRQRLAAQNKFADDALMAVMQKLTGETNG